MSTLDTYVVGQFDRLNESRDKLYETVISFDVSTVPSFNDALCYVRFESADNWKQFHDPLVGLFLYTSKSSETSKTSSKDTDEFQFVTALSEPQVVVVNDLLNLQPLYDKYNGVKQWPVPLCFTRQCQALLDRGAKAVIQFKFLSVEKMGWTRHQKQILSVFPTHFDNSDSSARSSLQQEFLISPSAVTSEMTSISYNELHSSSTTTSTSTTSATTTTSDEDMFLKKRIRISLDSAFRDKTAIHQLLIHPPAFEKHTMFQPDSFTLVSKDHFGGESNLKMYQYSYDAHYTDKRRVGFPTPKFLYWSLTFNNWSKSCDKKHALPIDASKKYYLDIVLKITRDSAAKFDVKKYCLDTWCI